MNIIHVSSELAQVAKAGGLGDVIYGLAKAQIKLGHKVTIVLPKYDCIEWDQLTDVEPTTKELWIEEGSQRYNTTVWKAKHEDLDLLLIEDHHPNYYFSRGFIYGANDDIDRFIFFSKAVLEYLFHKDIQTDVVHIHDWPTAIIAPLYKDIYAKKEMKIDRLICTIHNLQYQGKCAPFHLERLGLNSNHYLHPERMQDPLDPLLVNLIKGAIVYSDAITTVSPTFKNEILTPLGGFSLNDTLLAHQDKLFGILNGIDENYWNPETDPLLQGHFPSFPNQNNDNFSQVLEGKEKNKTAVQKKLGLDQKKTPLVASITRLVTQKGPDLILHAIKRTLEKGGQYVLLGSLPEGDLLSNFMKLKNDYSKGQLSQVFEHDEELAHLLYGGADILVVPSIFEPCGLTQMISMRYGCIPVVRKTGGLADTVFDVDTAEIPKEKRNGYSFDFPDNAGIDWALDRALTCYETNSDKWHTLIKHALTQDFSWKATAPQYLKLYEKTT